VARRDLTLEAVGDLTGIAELEDRCLRGFGWRQSGALVAVRGVKESGSQFGHDVGMDPG
jgi:hypothetical protein